jgi:hypothetical protein
MKTNESAAIFDWVQPAEYLYDVSESAKFIGVMRTQRVYAGSAPGHDTQVCDDQTKIFCQV